MVATGTNTWKFRHILTLFRYVYLLNLITNDYYFKPIILFNFLARYIAAVLVQDKLYYLALVVNDKSERCVVNFGEELCFRLRKYWSSRLAGTLGHQMITLNCY